MHARVYTWISIPFVRQIPIMVLFVDFEKALRPLGLAVTASDYLDSMQIDTSTSVLERCLQRYMMNPSLCRLESLDPAAISGRSTRLRDNVLERQHSLGVHFTRQALGGLCVSEGLASWTVRAKRLCLSNLARHAPETFQSQDRSASTILAWVSCNFNAASFSRGRISGFQQDRSERDQWLPPIQVEHERLLPTKSVADTVSYTYTRRKS